MPRPTNPSVAAAELDGRCLDLRRSGATYRQIAAQLSISAANAHKRVTRSLDRTRREPADALRELELERLDALQEALTRVLGRAHVTVSGGKVVVDDQGKPYLNDGPVIAAAQALVRVQESRRKLLGLDAPARHQVEAKVQTIDELDAQIAELEGLLTNSDPNWPALKRQREAREQAVERFRRTWVPPEPGWESPRQHTDPRADVAGFVADALELGVALLCLEPEDQEQLAIGIEFFLRERAR